MFPWRELHEKDKKINDQTVADKTTGAVHRRGHDSYGICSHVFTIKH